MNGINIWEEIKNKDINMFAILSKIENYCQFVNIDPDKCYVSCKATSTLPALEIALGPKFKCTMVNKYVLIERVENDPTV